MAGGGSKGSGSGKSLASAATPVEDGRVTRVDPSHTESLKLEALDDLDLL